MGLTPIPAVAQCSRKKADMDVHGLAGGAIPRPFPLGQFPASRTETCPNSGFCRSSFVPIGSHYSRCACIRTITDRRAGDRALAIGPRGGSIWASGKDPVASRPPRHSGVTKDGKSDEPLRPSCISRTRRPVAGRLPGRRRRPGRGRHPRSGRAHRTSRTLLGWRHSGRFRRVDQHRDHGIRFHRSERRRRCGNQADNLPDTDQRPEPGPRRPAGGRHTIHVFSVDTGQQRQLQRVAVVHHPRGRRDSRCAGQRRGRVRRHIPR